MKSKTLTLLSVILLGLAATIALSPNVQKKIADRFITTDREVLTVLSANLINDGKDFKILKVRENNQLKIEVFTFDDQKKKHSLVDYVVLKYKQDGFYKFGKEATNLFTHDLNNDGILEIIAPTYSPKLKPQLNIVSLNPTSMRLEWSNQNILGY